LSFLILDRIPPDVPVEGVDGRFPSTNSTCYTLVWALNYN
jgi:hypothetical protein